MAEPKKSRFNRLVDWIKGTNSSKDDQYIEEGIPGHSLKVIADKKLEERLSEWNMAIDLINEPITATTLYDYMGECLDIIKTLHKTVMRIAGVYACAGDQDAEDAKHLMHGWAILVNNAKSRAERTQRWWGTNESVTDARAGRQSINAITVFNFQLGMYNILFKYADMVVAFCFKRIDVTPRHITAIQTMMQNGNQMLSLPTSGGRTSEDGQMQKPQGGPYPNRIKNTVG